VGRTASDNLPHPKNILQKHYHSLNLISDCRDINIQQYTTIYNNTQQYTTIHNNTHCRDINIQQYSLQRYQYTTIHNNTQQYTTILIPREIKDGRT